MSFGARYRWHLTCPHFDPASFKRSLKRHVGVEQSSREDVCRAELVGRTVKMARKVLNDSEVSAPGRIGEITTLEFLKHQLS